MSLDFSGVIEFVCGLIMAIIGVLIALVAVLGFGASAWYVLIALVLGFLLGWAFVAIFGP